MKHLAILGATGFIGRYVSQVFLTRHPDWKLTCLGRQRPAALSRFANFHELNASDPDSLSRIFDRLRPSHVLNCVGVINTRSREEYTRWNTRYPESIISSLKANSTLERLVLIGSAAEYGNPLVNPVSEESTPLAPISEYGRSKVAQTELAREASKQGFPVHIGRVFNVLGPDMSSGLAPGQFIQQVIEAADGTQITTGVLSSMRDFLDVRDVAHALIIILTDPVHHLELNVCSGVPTRMRHLLETIIRVSGKNLSVREGERETARNSSPEVVGSPRRLKALGWHPRFTLEESVRFALNDTRAI